MLEYVRQFNLHVTAVYQYMICCTCDIYMCSSSLAAWRFGKENVDSKGRRSHQHNAGPGLVGIKFHRDINLSGEQLSKSNCENNPGNLFLI